METMYYTLTAREIVVEGDAVAQASGGARQLVCLRKAARPAGRDDGREKVIDLAAWKAEKAELERLEDEWYGDVADYEDEEYEAAAPAEPRARRSHRSAFNGELLASLAVVGAMAVLVLRMLVF